MEERGQRLDPAARPTAGAGARTDTDAVVARLSTMDRFLPVWIGAAMVGGCCWVAWCRGWTMRWMR